MLPVMLSVKTPQWLLQGSFLLYFKSPWNIVDFLSTALLFACVIVWWDFALRDALPFDIDLR